MKSSIVPSWSESRSLTSSPVLTEKSGYSAAMASRSSPWPMPSSARTETLLAFSPSLNSARACSEVNPTPT